MNKKHLIHRLFVALFACGLATACITEDFHECPNTYVLKIVYDRNMLSADAFASMVKSVDVKVFESATGREVYRHSEEGEALAADGYCLTLPLDPGTYDILCWGSMAEGKSFGYASSGQENLSENGVLLDTGNGTSSLRLNNLFHGLMTAVPFPDNDDTGTPDVHTFTLHLTKDTNRVNIILHNLDGTAINENGFIFELISNNGEMAFDNSLRASRAVTYKPWHIAGLTSDTDHSRAAVQTAVSAELSLARLCAESKSRLNVYRNSDGERIISIPLEANLLLYKGAFHASMSDDEYLNRQDDYTLTFILDRNNNWDAAAMIYINDWATLPVQYEEW